MFLLFGIMRREIFVGLSYISEAVISAPNQQNRSKEMTSVSVGTFLNK